MAVPAKKPEANSSGSAPQRSGARAPAVPATKRTGASGPAKPSPRLTIVKAERALSAQDRLKSWSLAVLETSRSNVFLCDIEFNIVYANKRSIETLQYREPDLRKMDGLTQFVAADVVGMNADFLFTDEPIELRRARDPRNHPYQRALKVGPCVCDVQITSLRDEKGSLVGYCADWVDNTDRLRADEEYKAAVKVISDRMEFLRANCITDMVTAMESFANGNLTFNIEPQTPPLEIPPQPDLALMAETFNQLRSQIITSVDGYNQAKEVLGSMIAKTRVAADIISQTSAEVAAGNEDLSQRTEEQASSLEETASSMEEMTSTVKQNADNARHANQLAAQAREVAEKGGAVVNNTVASMDAINKASKRIADIISVIDEIAFQTNLLALNAAVEAARVGEQGRGFAVVAAEVRNLAGRSATAAKEIKALVQDSVQKVQEGSSLANQSGKHLEEIVSSVKKVADIIAEIAAASEEQSAGIEQVNKAIMQMDQITQQNAALVEEAAAASQSMSHQAQDLKHVVGEFKLDSGHLEAHACSAPPPLRVSAPAFAPRAERHARTAISSMPSYRAVRPAFQRKNDQFEEF